MATVSIDQLKISIEDIVKTYSYKLNAEVEKAVRLTAGHCRDNIKANAPKRTGKYAKSWTVKYNTSKSGKSFTGTVHATAPKYRLTHLLERPHRIANQYGDNWGKTSPHPHIADAAKTAETELTQRVETAVKNLGL